MSTEIWLYGSVARGTSNGHSDLDLLVASGDASFAVEDIDQHVAHLPRAKFKSVTSYTWEQLAAMASYGSLFILHLRMEGELLVRRGDGPGLKHLMEDMPPYLLVGRDLQGFSSALSDVGESLADGGDPSYELSVLATVMRHCSVLTCYLIGDPQFSREESLCTSLQEFGMGMYVPGALDIYKYRMARSRALALPQPARRGEALYWLDVATRFVNSVRGRYE